MPGFIDRLQSIVSSSGLLLGDDAAPHLQDWRRLYQGRAEAVVRPADAEQVAAVVRACLEHGVAITPQGGNTSMVGGATPSGEGRNVVLSLARMNRVSAVDPTEMTMTVEAGLPWQVARDAAAAAGCLLPLSIASEGTAQVGGVLSANAGGNNTVRYGNARDLALGLEAVLPDGQIWHGLRQLRKDNTGYCLRHLLIGAEGTLGIITAAVLKLAPQPADTQAALCAVPSVGAACALFRRFQQADPTAIQAFEYMSGDGMQLVLDHIPGCQLPLEAPARHYVLAELAGPGHGDGLRARLEAILEAALEEELVLDAVIAESEGQRQAIWKLREEHSEAQKQAGASVKNDVSVPVSRVTELIEQASEAGAALVAGIRPVPFGHLGDGNIHLNFEQPETMPADAFLAQSGAIMETVNAIVRRLGGSFSAEHGVGQLKPALMPAWRGGAELDAMRRIKHALDPAGIMNPGKLLP